MKFEYRKILKPAKYIIIPILISILVCIAGLFGNQSYIYTVRAAGDYTFKFNNDQTVVQELFLSNATKIQISALAFYDDIDNNAGAEYSIKTGDKIKQGFIPLCSLLNREWDTFSIPIDDIYWSGDAVITLKAVNMDDINYLKLLVGTSDTNDPRYSLSKDGSVIENGQLVYGYYSYSGIKKLPIIFFCSLIVSILIYLCIVNKKIGISRYPAVYASVILFAAVLIYNYSSLSNINMHVSAQYFFSYQNLGFVRRSLLGTIIELLGIDLNVERYVAWGIFLNAVVMILGLCFVYCKKNSDIRSKLEKGYFLFICTPFAFSSLFGHHFFARLDQLLMIAFIVSCFLIINNKGYIAIPIISIVAILIHEMYLTMLFPFLFAVMLIKWYVSRKKKDMILLVVSSAISVALFIAVSFIFKPVKTFEDAFAYTLENSEHALSDYTTPMRLDFFSSRIYAVKDSIRVILSYNTVLLASLSVIMLLLLIIMAVLWFKKYYCTKKQDKLGKVIVFILPLTLFGLILSMATMCDWGRLFVLYGYGVFYTLASLMSIDKENVLQSITSVITITKAKFGESIFCILGVFYLLLSIYDGGASSTTLFPFMGKFL